MSVETGSTEMEILKELGYDSDRNQKAANWKHFRWLPYKDSKKDLTFEFFGFLQSFYRKSASPEIAMCDRYSTEQLKWIS